MFINVKIHELTPYYISLGGKDESSLDICEYTLFFLHLSCRYCPIKDGPLFWKPLSFG